MSSRILNNSNLRLIHSQREDEGVLIKTDSLIDSAFNFISLYLGENATTDDIYSNAIVAFEELTLQGYLPISYVYMPDLDLWEKRVNLEVMPNKKLDILLGGDALRKLNDLTKLFASYPCDDYAHLNLQEALDYSCYLYFESFLNFLEGKKTPLILPFFIQTLRRPNLDYRIQKAINNVDRIVFTGENVGFYESKLNY